MSNRKRCLNLQEKCEIIYCLRNGESVLDVARRYGIAKRTIYRMRQNQNIIEEAAESYKNTDGDIRKRKSISTSADMKLDTSVYEWFKERRSRGIPVSGPLLCKKAIEMHKSMYGESDFKASNGWLKNFKSRHGIRLLRIQGEKLSDISSIIAVS